MTGSPCSTPSNASVPNNNGAQPTSASNSHSHAAGHGAGAGAGGAGSFPQGAAGGDQGSGPKTAFSTAGPVSSGTAGQISSYCPEKHQAVLHQIAFVQQQSIIQQLISRIIHLADSVTQGKLSLSEVCPGSDFALQQLTRNGVQLANNQQVAPHQPLQGNLGGAGSGGPAHSDFAQGSFAHAGFVSDFSHVQGVAANGNPGHRAPEMAPATIVAAPGSWPNGQSAGGHSTWCETDGCGQTEGQGAAHVENRTSTLPGGESPPDPGNGTAGFSNGQQGGGPHASSAAGSDAHPGRASGSVRVDQAKPGGGKTGRPQNPGPGPAARSSKMVAKLSHEKTDVRKNPPRSAETFTPGDDAESSDVESLEIDGPAEPNQGPLHAAQLQEGCCGSSLGSGSETGDFDTRSADVPQAQGRKKRAGVLPVPNAGSESRGVFGFSRDAPLAEVTTADIRGDQHEWTGRKFLHEATRSNVRSALGRRNRFSKVARGKQLKSPLHAKNVAPMHLDLLMKQMLPQIAKKITSMLISLQSAPCDQAPVDAKFRASLQDAAELRAAGAIESTEFTGKNYTSVRYFTVYEALKDRRRPIMWPWMFLLCSDYQSEFSLSNVSQYCKSVFAGSHACAFDLSASFWQVVIENCNFVLQDESGKLWRITRLPFGVDCASEIMQLIVEELGRIATVRAGLKSADVTLFVHIDNIMCIGDQDVVRRWKKAFLQVCDSFNVTLNDEPRNNAVSQECEFAGILLDFASDTVRPRDSFINGLPEAAGALASFTSLESCIGKLLHGLAIRQFSASKYHRLFKWWRLCLSRLARGTMSWETRPFVAADVRAELESALAVVGNKSMSRVRRCPILRADDITPQDVANDAVPTLVVDATLDSFGGVLYERGHVVAAYGEKFRKPAASMGLAEIAGALAMIDYFSSRLHGRCFVLLTDNTSCESGVRKGASSHLDMDRAAYAIHSLLEHIDAKVHVAHIDTKANVADSLSRLRPIDESKIEVSRKRAQEVIGLLTSSRVGESVRKIVCRKSVGVLAR